MINALSSAGKPSGIFSSKFYWTNVMGGTYGCYYASVVPLWYANPSPSGDPSFSDFEAFGGWFNPSAKQYYSNGGGMCGVSVNYDYYES